MELRHNYIIFIVLYLLVSDAKKITKTTDYIDQSTESSNEENNKETTSDWERNTASKLDELDKNLQNILPVLGEKMELKFYKMFEKMEDLINTKLKTDIFAKLDGDLNNLEKSIGNIENKIMPSLKNDINGKIDELEKKIPDNLEENINIKFKTLETTLQNTENKLKLEKCENNTVNNIPNNNNGLPEIKTKLNDLEEMINNLKGNLHCKSVTDYDLQGNIGNRFSLLENRAEKLLEITKKTHSCQRKNIDQGCKTTNVQGYNFNQYYPVDDATFNHVVLKRDYNDVKYFHINIAIWASANGIVKLSSTANPGTNDFVLEIVFGGNGNSNINFRRGPYENYKGVVIRYGMANVLSTARFTPFYIKLSNGKLEVGASDQKPILSHYDDSFKLIKYISFGSWENLSATFLFDCPITVDE